MVHQVINETPNMIALPSSRPVFDGFSSYYQSDIAPYLDAKEGARQNAVKHFYAAMGLTTLCTLIVFFFLPWQEARFHAAFAVVVIGGSIGYASVTKVRNTLTHGLLERICRHFKFSYRRDLSRPDYYDMFRRLDLLPNHNKEDWEDEIKGAHSESGFSFCEAHLKKQSSGKKKRTVTVFHGQLLVLDYHKEFLGETVIKRDAGVFNGFMKPNSKFQRVGIASPKFEKIFEAWSTDQVEARELLDPLVLERFEELDRLFDGAKLRAAFAGGKLYVALESGDKLNIGSMFTPLQGPERTEKILKEFDLIFDLIDVLVKRVDRRMDGAFSVDSIKSA